MPPSTVNLGQLVDLALGTPEIGAVNFNVLHTLLHSLLERLNLEDTKAEIPEEHHRLLARKLDGDQESGIFSVRGEDGTDGESSVAGSVPPKGKDRTGSKSTPYHALEKRMARMEGELQRLNELPTNQDLITRSHAGESTGAQPVQDMWQTMKLEKRVEANEQGINKLMSLMQDLIKEVNTLKDEQKLLRNEFRDFESKFKDMQDTLNGLAEKLEGYPHPDEFGNFVTWEGLEGALKGLREHLERPTERVVVDMTAQTEKVDTTDRPVSAKSLSSRPGSSRAGSRGPSTELADLLEKLGKLTERFGGLEARLEQHFVLIKELDDKKADKHLLEGLTPQPRVELPPQMSGVPDDLLAQIAQLKADLEKLMGDRSKDEETLGKLQKALLELQDELAKVANTAKDLIEENNQKQKHIEALYTFVDRLQENKADKEYVDAEIDVKADKKLLDGKVSRQLFDATCEELNKLINDLLAKLTGHEDAWKKSYSQLTTDLDGKLDRLELDPLREYLEKRMKQLDKRTVKTTVDMNFEDEAAVLRKQLLTRFNCLSCDRPVDMMPHEPQASLPDPRGFPGKGSTRPYQVYELDQIRQHARRTTALPPIGAPEGAWYSKFPTTGYTTSYGGQPDVTQDYYQVTRACGGGHTVTFPHKRMTKLPANVTLTARDEPEGAQSHREEAEVQGADGHVYKGRHDKREDVRRITVSQQIRRLAQDQRPTTSPQPNPPPTKTGRPVSARSARGENNRPVSSRQRRPRTAAALESRDKAPSPDGASDHAAPISGVNVPMATHDDAQEAAAEPPASPEQAPPPAPKDATPQPEVVSPRAPPSIDGEEEQ